MSTTFDNGIDLSGLLWSMEHHLADPVKKLPPEVILAHNEIVARLAERLSIVTHFQFSERVSIIWRQGNLWSVSECGLALNRDGDWEYEPSPSNRTDEFKARTRFHLEEAFARATADALSRKIPS
jgi:hypothetical protein